MGIEQITRSIDTGEFALAQKAIKELPQSDEIIAMILRADLLTHNNQIHKATSVIDQALDQSRQKGDWFLELGALTLKSYILYKKGKFEEGQKIAESAELIVSLLSSNGPKVNTAVKERWEAILLYVNALYYFTDDQFEIALEYVKKCVDIFERHEIESFTVTSKILAAKIYRLKSMYNLSLSYYYELYHSIDIDDPDPTPEMIESIEGIAEIHFERGQYDLALHFFKDLEAYYKRKEDNKNLGRTYQYLGKIHIHRGNFDEAFEDFQQSVILLTEEDDQRGQGFSNLQIASANFMRGNLDGALAIYEECLGLFNKIDDQLMIAWTFRSIGEINRVKGDYETALDYYKSNLHLLEELNHNAGKAEGLNKIGIIYQYQGKLNWALDYFQRSLSIFIKIGDKSNSVDTIFNLIQIKLEMGSTNQATFFLRLLADIAEKSQDKRIIQKHRIAQALVYKNHKRLTEKVEGLKIFQQISEEAIIDHEMTVIAMLNLCDMLMMELFIYQENEVLEQVKFLSSELYEIAQEQKSFKLLVEALMLQAKFALIDGDANRALSLLDQARVTIKEKNLYVLQKKAEKQMEDLRNQLSAWEQLHRENAPLRDRIQMAEIDGYIERIFG